ncbi:MAG: small multi-drug export protein [Candidatus Methanosuratincola sp.]
MLSPEIYTFILAMSPIVESRGAIPYGVIAGIEPRSLIVLSIAGNILPIPFLLLLLSKIENLITNRPEESQLRRLYLKYIGSLRRRAKKKIDKYGFFGVMLFVAVPVPGSGAWTGSLVAHLFGLEKKKSLVAIILGTVEAAAIVYALVTLLGFVI